jgi:hypothetical protein
MGVDGVEPIVADETVCLEAEGAPLEEDPVVDEVWTSCLEALGLGVCESSYANVCLSADAEGLEALERVEEAESEVDFLRQSSAFDLDVVEVEEA